MACDILKKTLKLNQTNIRHQFLPVITDILSRFDSIINGDLNKFINIYGNQTYTISDKYGQARDYIGRIYEIY